MLMMLMMMRKEQVPPFFVRHRDGHTNCELGSVEDKPFYCMPNVTKTASRTSLSTECLSAEPFNLNSASFSQAPHSKREKFFPSCSLDCRIPKLIKWHETVSIEVSIDRENRIEKFKKVAHAMMYSSHFSQSTHILAYQQKLVLN